MWNWLQPYIDLVSEDLPNPAFVEPAKDSTQGKDGNNASNPASKDTAAKGTTAKDTTATNTDLKDSDTKVTIPKTISIKKKVTKYNSLSVGPEDGRFRLDPAPYTFVEGYLQLARPLVQPDI